MELRPKQDVVNKYSFKLRRFMYLTHGDYVGAIMSWLLV